MCYMCLSFFPLASLCGDPSFLEKMVHVSFTPTEFAKLIQTIWTSSPNDVVSPSEFKTQIQRYAPRFVGYK